MARRQTAAELAAAQEILRSTILEVSELEDPSEEDIKRSDDALAEFEDLEVKRAAAVEYEDRLEVVRAADLNQAAREPGDIRRHAGGGLQVQVKTDPFDVLRSNTHHMDKREITRALRDSNLKALEEFELPDGYTGSFEKLIKRHGRDTSWAMNMLSRMRPEYVEGWEKVMTGRELMLSDIERAAMAVGTNTAGGYLVPTHLDPTLILTNNGTSNVIRGLSRVVTLTGGANRWNGVTTAGSTASWDAELSEVSDDTPAVANAQIPVFAAKSLIQASIESFEDIANLGADVLMLLNDSKDRLEGAAHATGNGSTAPTGIFTALDANTNVELSLTTGHTWTLADIQTVKRSVGIRWRPKGVWLMNPLFLGEIQALGTALSASYSTDLTEGYTDRILGRPVVESDDAPSTSQTTTVDNLLVYGDFSNFVIVDKPGSTSIEFIPHMFNVANNLPDGRRAWYMHFRNGADSVNDLAFRLLQDKTTA